MLSNGQIKALEDLHDNLYFEIRAAEDWATSYKDAPKQFGALIRSENRQLRALKAYFLKLSAERIAYWVNWDEYKSRIAPEVKAAVTINVTISEQNPQYTAEQTLLAKVMIDEIEEEMKEGVLAAEATYAVPLGTAEINQLVAKQALDHAAELAKGLNSTTLSQVQKSIETSITEGEDISDAIERLQGIIADPVRAEMIARTESVRSFQAGKAAYAAQTGATTKTWEALADADAGSNEQPCVDNDGQGPIDIDDDFDSGDPYPPAHPNCRCDTIYQYPNGNEDDSDDITDLG